MTFLRVERRDCLVHKEALKEKIPSYAWLQFGVFFSISNIFSAVGFLDLSFWVLIVWCLLACFSITNR